MNLLLNSIVSNRIIFDVLGLVGLSLLVLAAWKLMRSSDSWGGTMIFYGALALFIARTYIVVRPQFVTFDFLASIGPVGIALLEGLRPIFLSFGLAGIVWGLWGHEKWLKDRA